ncbi:MAG: S-layer homology domain-containing protein [Lachnospiraceae bacterium]|nr:S-layer homology domain-containing protein [Lachnospiraceae bacterium]
MIKKCKKITVIALLVAMIMTAFSVSSVYASETDEDNPVVEVTEHGIIITKSCAEAIDQKLYTGAMKEGMVFDDGCITLLTNDYIAPYELYNIEYVDTVEGYPDFNLYIVHCDSSLSIRETAALFAEDERVINMSPHSYGEFCDTPAYSHYFQDIDKNAYYCSAVVWASKYNDIARGYKENGGEYFGVGRPCTRKDFLIFLWRAKGRPESENIELGFNDVGAYSKTSDTYKAISWAVSKGITKGFSDGGFHPNEIINRKDALIMMYRATGSNTTAEVEFPDVLSLGCSKNSDTYRAIAWAEMMGITHGYNDGTFRPMEKCLREQAITFLYRYALKGY